MKFERLSELIEDRITGEWGQEPSSTGVKVIRTTNFTNEGKLDLSNVVERDIDEKKVTRKSLRKGDIIIEKSGGGPTQPVGRVVFFDIDSNEKYLCNNFTTILRSKRELVDSKYLLYQMLYLHKSGRTKKYQNKTTGIHNLNLDKYLQERIPLPPLPDQLHIANLLSKAESLIAQRKESIRLLDEYLKSTFLEMFGDPVRNEKGWEIINCENLFDMKLGKMLSAKNYSGNNLYPYLRNVNVKWGEVELGDLKKMDFTETEVFNYSLKVGDILVCEGGEVGRTAILKEDLINHCYQNALHRLRIKDKSRICAEYFYWLMYIGVNKGLIRKHTISVTIAHFTMEKFKRLKIPVPTLKDQLHFAQIAEGTEALKSQFQESLQEFENLYGSLSKRAFRGGMNINIYNQLPKR